MDGLDLTSDEQIVMLRELDGPVLNNKSGSANIAGLLLARLNEFYRTSNDQSYVNYNIKVKLCPASLLTM